MMLSEKQIEQWRNILLAHKGTLVSDFEAIDFLFDSAKKVLTTQDTCPICGREVFISHCSQDHRWIAHLKEKP